MGSFAIAWPGDSAEHVCRKRHTCSAEAECDISVELTTRMAHGGHCEQDFQKDGVDRHLDRPSPVIPQPFLHLQNFVERQKRLWSEFNPLPPCSSNFVESDPTTAQDFESCTVVVSDSATLDEQGGQLVVLRASLRAIPGAGFRHLSPLPDGRDNAQRNGQRGKVPESGTWNCS